MIKQIVLAVLGLAATVAHAGATLTAQETRWLQAGAPVLAYAARLHLPVDIVVQPQAKAGDVPLAMGFDQGRCKLVMSLRGNASAEASLAGVPEAERGMLIEAMTAHELGHCWRYAHGVWRALPAGFVEVGEEQADDAALLAASKELRENRREEGFADLAALAWTRQFHGAQYQRVHAWLTGLRSAPALARSTHDTRAWVRLAADPSVFAGSASSFDAALPLWEHGLLGDE